MSAKRALIPVLLILVCAAILLAYNRLRVAMPAPSVTPSLPSTPYPTPPVPPTSEPTTPPANPPQAAIPAVGDLAPEFSLPSVSGGTVSVSDYRGTRDVLLLFYRTGG